MEIPSLKTAIEPANDPHDPHDVALRTGGDHNDDDKQDEGEGEGVVHGPTVLAHVDLAKKAGTLPAVSICLSIG
jgi:GTP cyclohydrolase III